MDSAVTVKFVNLVKTSSLHTPVTPTADEKDISVPHVERIQIQLNTLLTVTMSVSLLMQHAY